MTRKVNILTVYLIVLTLSSCGVLPFTQQASDSPEDSKIITSDINNFYHAFDLAVQDTANAEKIFKENYFSVGSPGLKDFYKSKIHSKEEFTDFVMFFQGFYQSIRSDISQLAELEQEIFRDFKKFKALYTEAVFPDVYFLVGRFSSNGTISNNGILIGTEILSRTPKTNTEGWNEDILRISMEKRHIAITVAHELTHFNQSGMKSGNTLLWKSIREGSAEFIAELITGKTDGNYEDFKGKELSIWKDFKEDMDKSVWQSWQLESNDRPRNAGYWAGYIICKAYLDQIGDKEQAISDILNIRDYDEFYQSSKVEHFLRQNFL